MGLSVPCDNPASGMIGLRQQSGSNRGLLCRLRRPAVGDVQGELLRGGRLTTLEPQSQTPRVGRDLRYAGTRREPARADDR